MTKTFHWAGFALGYVSCYFLSTALPTPVLWYFPVDRRFVLGVKPEGVAMDFYGRILLCLLAGAVGFALAAGVVRRMNAESRARSVRLLAAWCAGVLVLTCGLYLYKLMGRHPTPLPLPPHYVPR